MDLWHGDLTWDSDLALTLDVLKNYLFVLPLPLYHRRSLQRESLHPDEVHVEETARTSLAHIHEVDLPAAWQQTTRPPQRVKASQREPPRARGKRKGDFAWRH